MRSFSIVPRRSRLSIRALLRPFVAVLGVLPGLAGCPDDPALTVRLYSDVRPATVRVRLGTAPFETFQENRNFAPGPFDDFLRGVDVANFGRLPSGDYFITVELRDATEDVLVEQTSLVRLEATSSVSFAIGESCLGVTCPSVGQSTCFAGTCVNPVCSSLAPESCAPVCVMDDDCPAGCGDARCVQGVCLGAVAGCERDGGSDGGEGTPDGGAIGDGASAPDGGAPTLDAGDDALDAGDDALDAGDDALDSGTTDGGLSARDGGTPALDGGGPELEGGTPPPDGGASAPDGGDGVDGGP